MAAMAVPPVRPQDDGAPRLVQVALEPARFRRTMATALVFVAGFLLTLWAFSVTSHFLFLLLLAWLFAVAMEPGIRALMRRGLSRGQGTAVVGLCVLLAAIAFAVVFGDL